MMQSVTEIHMDDFVVATRPRCSRSSPFPLCFSIAEGIGLGLICAAVLALAAGRPSSLSIAGYVIAAAVLPRFLQDPSRSAGERGLRRVKATGHDAGGAISWRGNASAVTMQPDVGPALVAGP